MARTDQPPLKPTTDFMRLAVVCLRGMVVVSVFILLVQTFLAEGLLTKFVISGASMSPTLHGTHFLLYCPECATGFCVETDTEAMTSPNAQLLRLAICPACSFARVPVPTDAQCQGNRIVINREVLSLRSIRRWDVVLFYSPDDGKLTVKRVVGLPGETLEIRNGDIVINGQIAVKPLAVQRDMRIPVLYGRWETQLGKSPDTCEFAWLPTRNTPHSGKRVMGEKNFPQYSLLATRYSQINGVTNQLCENQWRIEPPGGIFPVHDLMLEFDWQPEDSLPLCVRTCTDNVMLNQTLATRNSQLATQHNGTYKVTVSLFDRQLLVAIDGVVIVDSPLDDAIQSLTDASPFALNLSENTGLSLSEQEAAVKRQVANLRVYRDVYYISDFRLQASGKHHEPPTPKPEARSPKPVTIPAGCYYVLGDNSGFSSDSRHWKEPFVTHRYLVGIVAP